MLPFQEQGDRAQASSSCVACAWGQQADLIFFVVLHKCSKMFKVWILFSLGAGKALPPSLWHRRTARAAWQTQGRASCPYPVPIIQARINLIKFSIFLDQGWGRFWVTKTSTCSGFSRISPSMTLSRPSQILFSKPFFPGKPPNNPL